MPMTHKSTIRITVVDGAGGSKCEGRCGLDFSKDETLKSTRELLHKRYGKRVTLEYVDLGGNQSGSSMEIAEMVRHEEMSLPLLLVNGKLRISGYFDLRSLQEAVQAEIEMAGD